MMLYMEEIGAFDRTEWKEYFKAQNAFQIAP